MSNQDWFIGTITNNDTRNLEIGLYFFDEDVSYIAFIYLDDENVITKTKVGIKKIKVQKENKVSLNLSPSGGTAIQIKKVLINNFSSLVFWLFLVVVD